MRKTWPAEKRGAGPARRRRVAGLVGVLSLLTLFTKGCSLFSAPRYKGAKSDHFDGERFINQGEVRSAGFGDVLRWQLTKDPRPWRRWTDAPYGAPPPERVGRGELRVTFVNHATTLVQVDGVNILTDPVWSERVSPVSFVGPKRVRPPGIRFEDLPPIDAVILSHNHYDHMDLPTLRRLGAAHTPRFIAGLGNARFLQREGIANAGDLDWWQSVELRNGVKLTAVPAQHFSNRGLADRDGTLWVGFVIEGSEGYTYFAGDTGYGPHFEQIRARFGRPRLAILPIGAFAPEWFMAPVHISPAEAVKAHEVLGAGRSVAMHFGTFKLADDGEEEPVERLLEAREAARVEPDRFWVLGFGEGRDVPPLGEGPSSGLRDR